MSHIDTLQAYEELISAGIPEKEAKAQVHLINSSVEASVTDLATKKDLEVLEKDLKYILISSFVGFIYAPLLVGLLIWGITLVFSK